MRISDWSSDVCSSDLQADSRERHRGEAELGDEGDRHRQRQKEFDRVDGAHRRPRGRALNQQVGGDDRPPAAAARRIEEAADEARSEEHTSELQSLMRNSYAVFCLKKKHTTHMP